MTNTETLSPSLPVVARLVEVGTSRVVGSARLGEVVPGDVVYHGDRGRWVVRGSRVDESLAVVRVWVARLV